MNKEELQRLFRQKYQFDNWKHIFNQLFRKVDWLATPQYLFENIDSVKKGFQFGSVALDDGKKLALFVVEVADGVNIVSNRVGLRGIAAKYIDQYITHGALVLFYSPTDKDYRFSFIAKHSEFDEDGNFTKTETQPKRFTYVLGENESCKTAAKRFEDLFRKNKSLIIKDFIDAFSVEKLSKDFFIDYRNKYYSGFIAYLTGEDVNGNKIPQLPNSPDYLNTVFYGDTKAAHDFVKKLLGRLVFMHFLQKKGWLGSPNANNDWTGGDPAFLQNLFKNCKDKERFLSSYLNDLFFNTLNIDRKDTDYIFPLTGTRVPYLNGGLFDNDSKSSNIIDFPIDYWHTDNEKGLLDFFEQYNFTIDENDPEEQEVGIDPEMLGHIFENLLEDNKDKGAFYTPKEIVQYMCQESLVQYLKTHLDTEGGLDDAIEQFVRQRKIVAAFEEKNMAHKINRLLKEVKICDPAIGSGAFPIGLLQEIYKARLHIYPFLKTATDFSPAKVKKEIIQNSIYGVDKDGGAVDIARLRFWLALIVDEDVPEPLPNLDYKIMQGDSLLESFEGIPLDQILQDKTITIIENGQLDFFGNIQKPQLGLVFQTETEQNDLKIIIDSYFTPMPLNEKQRLRHLVEQKIHDVIEFNVELEENKILIQKADVEKQIRSIKFANTDSAGLKQKKQKSLDNLNSRLVSLNKLWLDVTEKRKRLLELQENPDAKPYFLWHAYFKDVFDEGGFDIVIGNPPYVQLQKMANSEKMYGNVGFETYSKSSDIYCLFYEKGVNLLSKGGVLAYITSNSWLQTKYGAALRKFLRKKTDPSVLLNFEDTQLFQTATVETNILLSKKQGFTEKLRAVAVQSDLRKIPIAEYAKRKQVILNSLDDNGWNVADATTYRIKAAIEEGSVLLKELEENEDWETKINFGIKTGFNKAFIIDESTKNDLVEADSNNIEILKPLLRGRDVQKFAILFENSYLINSHNGLKKSELPRINIPQNFPVIFEYFKEYQAELQLRQDKGVHWTNLRDCAYFQDFEKPKIIWADIADKPKFVFDDKGFYTNDRCWIMTGNYLKYLLSIFNSKVVEWYFNQISTSSGMGTNMWKKYKIEQLPIKQINVEEMRPFEVLADYLLYLHDSKKADISSTISNSDLAVFFEEVLNGCVFELYFEQNMKDREINILAFVDTMTPSVSEASESEKRQIIYSSYQKLNAMNSPVRERIRLFAVRSPEILLPILKST